VSGGRGGRPVGPERVALLAAAQALHQQGKAGTWRDLAALAQVGYGVAQRTCWNMVKAGELQVVGYQAGTGPGAPWPCCPGAHLRPHPTPCHYGTHGIQVSQRNLHNVDNFIFNVYTTR